MEKNKRKKPDWVPCLGVGCRRKINLNVSTPIDGYCMECREDREAELKLTALQAFSNWLAPHMRNKNKVHFEVQSSETAFVIKVVK